MSLWLRIHSLLENSLFFRYIRSMKLITLGLFVVIILALGCGKVDYEPEYRGAGDDESAVSVGLNTTIKGKKFAKNITKATENVKKMTDVVKDDVTQVTGQARKIASQVSAITEDGVTAGVFVEPRTKPPVFWEYLDVNATNTDRKSVLDEQGRLGWELVSERPRDGGGVVLQLKRSKP